MPKLIDRAYKHENTAALLLVKGQPDYIADREGIYAVIDMPVEKAMEAIGGPGPCPGGKG